MAEKFKEVGVISRMKAQLYLYDWLREKFQEPIKLFYDTYSNRINPIFESIEEESNAIAEEKYQELGRYFNPDYHDPADFAEQAWEAGLEHYEGLALMKYNTKLMWI